MKSFHLDLSGIYQWIKESEIRDCESEIRNIKKVLESGTGKGNDFLGWIQLPKNISDNEIEDIETTAKYFKDNCQYVVCVGIGGSYLGTKAVVEALGNSFDPFNTDRKNPAILFAGHNIGEDYLYEMVEFLGDKKFGIVNISKSGTTTEPAIAFRVLKNLLETKVGKNEARKLIVAITDEKKGALRQLATQEGYKTYVIPDNVGGRFSVMTPVGLLPISIAGYDIKKLVQGAREMMDELTADTMDIGNHLSARYAVARNLLYRKGKKIEILGNFNPKLHYIGEWWKQLYGESEGKDAKGIFNASVDFSTDLHSMGQWIQDGERSIFETIISVKNTNNILKIESDKDNLDGLNYISGKRIDEVNKMAELGTRLAHIDGGVPNIRIEIDKLDEYNIGALFYFFEHAVGLSGYMLDVNPFDQPGVENYKTNMFALLEKPGFENLTEQIKRKI